MLDLKAIRRKPARFAIGLMSGTSCDGVDAALVRLKGSGKNLAVKLIDYKEFPYPTEFRTQLLNERMSAAELCKLNFEVGNRLADAVAEMLTLADEKQLTVDFVASHGHTVAHFPPPLHERIGTLQIGEPSIIAERFGLPVISDFRCRDMAAGGQGAPLVPYADWALFRRDDTSVCLNIGGIANFTVVTPRFAGVRAFDTGPGNMPIDGAMRILTQGRSEMDKGGRVAARGKVIDEFLDYLLDHPFFEQRPPKSTGRETFGDVHYLRDALASRRDHPFENLMATVTEAVGRSIARAFEDYVRPEHAPARMIVSGGGVSNHTLMKIIRRELADIEIFTSDQYGIPHGAREAVAFAILGNETLCGTPANVPLATGAAHPAILGKITPP
jgi:anhydro-N-acetylmuramic acid kinase